MHQQVLHNVSVLRTVVGVSIDGLHRDVNTTASTIKQPVAGAEPHVVCTGRFTGQQEIHTCRLIRVELSNYGSWWTHFGFVDPYVKINKVCRAVTTSIPPAYSRSRHWVKPCPHCRRKLSLLSRRFLRQSHFSATVWTGLNNIISVKPDT